MTGLATGFASGVFGTEGFGAFESVAGGWFAAVGTVFVETLFQLGDASFEFRNGDFLCGNDLANSVDTALIQGSLDSGTEDCDAVGHYRIYVRSVKIA